MASLSSLDGGLGSLGIQLSGLAGNANDASEDAGINSQRLIRNYSQRDLPSLVNRYASRGTFYSGGARVAGDRLREDTFDQLGDTQRLLTRQLSDFARQRVLAALGVVV